VLLHQGRQPGAASAKRRKRRRSRSRRWPSAAYDSDNSVLEVTDSENDFIDDDDEDDEDDGTEKSDQGDDY